MPTGRSRVQGSREESTAPQVPVQSAIVACMVGIAEMGPIGAANDDNFTPITSLAQYRALYGGPTANSADLYLSVKGFFDEAGDGSGAQLFISRVTHCTTPGTPSSTTSAKGSVYLLTAALAATKGTVLGSVVGPFDLDPGNNEGAFSRTIKLKVDGAGAVTTTITAAAAARESAAETFNISNGQTFTINVGAGVKTKTFLTADNEFSDYSAVTAEELATVLNAFFWKNSIAAFATVTSSGTKVTVTTTKRGSGATLTIAGTATLGFTAGALAGTGNVADVHAATVAELKAALEGAVSGQTVTNVGGAVQIQTNTIGAGGSIQVDATSTLAVVTILGLDTAIHTGTAGGAENTLLWEGRWDGAYTARLTIQVSAASNGDPTRKNVKVLRDGVATGEEWRNVNKAELIAAVNEGGNGYKKSRLLTVSSEGSLSAPDDLPANGTSAALSGGDDGLVGLTDQDFIGAKDADAGATGLRVFDLLQRVDEVAIPGRGTAACHNAVVTYAEVTRGQRTFFTLGPAANMTATQIREHVTDTAALKGLSEFGRIVWPRVKVDNPDQSVFGTGTTVVAPPEGVIMGMHARVSALRVGGAFTQASGVQNGFLRSVRGLETREGEDEEKRDLLHDDRINVIRAERGKPRYVDGPDTLKVGVFKSVGESRGAVLVLNDLSLAFADDLQLNIDEALYSSLTSRATVYLEKLTKAGSFKSRRFKEAFFVDFGPGLNTEDVAEGEEVIGRIGLATSRPAKYITLLLTRMTGFQASLEAA